MGLIWTVVAIHVPKQKVTKRKKGEGVFRVLVVLMFVCGEFIVHLIWWSFLNWISLENTIQKNAYCYLCIYYHFGYKRILVQFFWKWPIFKGYWLAIKKDRCFISKRKPMFTCYGHIMLQIVYPFIIIFFVFWISEIFLLVHGCTKILILLNLKSPKWIFQLFSPSFMKLYKKIGFLYDVRSTA